MGTMYFYITSNDNIVSSGGYKLVVDADVNSYVNIYYSLTNPLPDEYDCDGFYNGTS